MQRAFSLYSEFVIWKGNLYLRYECENGSSWSLSLAFLGGIEYENESFTINYDTDDLVCFFLFLN